MNRFLGSSRDRRRVPRETSNTYLQTAPDTGQETKLDWVDVGTPAWQRVAP